MYMPVLERRGQNVFHAKIKPHDEMKSMQTQMPCQYIKRSYILKHYKVTKTGWAVFTFLLWACSVFTVCSMGTDLLRDRLNHWSTLKDRFGSEADCKKQI